MPQCSVCGIAEEMSLAQRVPTHTIIQRNVAYAAGSQIAVIVADVCGAVCLLCNSALVRPTCSKSQARKCLNTRSVNDVKIGT